MGDSIELSVPLEFECETDEPDLQEGTAEKDKLSELRKTWLVPGGPQMVDIDAIVANGI
jgi:hypothetical protein